MRIENIKPETLKAETDVELKSLRARCAQVFSKEKMPAGLRRSEVLKKYVMLRIEMRKRRIPDPAPNWLEEEARLRIAKRAIIGIDVPGLPELVLKENFAAIVGAFIKNPKTAADLEIIVKGGRSEAMESAITKALVSDCGLPSGFTYTEFGIPTPHIPLYDLVLRPKAATAKAPAEIMMKADIPPMEAPEAAQAPGAFTDLPGGSAADEGPGLSLQIVKVDKALQIVGGIIYEPKAVDTQGDFTDAAEITKAMYGFMEGYSENPSRIKVMHEGRPYYFPILECFQPDEDTKKGKDVIKAGAWYLTIKVKDPEIWADIENGNLTAFSMGGSARKAN